MTETSQVLPSPERMGDPFVVCWVLEQMEAAARRGDGPRHAALRALLTHETIRRGLLEDDLDCAGSLLEKLDVASLQPVADLLEAGWADWPAPKAAMAAERLAEVAPDRFRTLLDEALGGDIPPCRAARVSGLAAGVLRMRREAAAAEHAGDPDGGAPGEMGKRAGADANALRLAEWLVTHPDAALREALADLVVSLAAPFGTGLQVPALVDLVCDGSDDDWWLPEGLVRAAAALSGGLPLLESAGRWRSHEESFLFRSLAPVLAPGTPAEELDRVAEEDIAECLAIVRELLDDGPDDGTTPAGELPIVPAARALLAAVPHPKTIDVADRLSAFGLAALLARYLRPDPDLSGATAEELGQLVCALSGGVPARSAVVAALRELGEEEAWPALGSQLAVEGVVHQCPQLFDVMADLGWPSLLEAIVDSLCRPGEITPDERVAAALVRFGPAAADLLLDMWEWLTQPAREMTLAVLADLGEPRLPATLAEIAGELLRDDACANAWALAAEAVPDARLVDLLHEQVERGNDWVKDSYVTLCAVLGESRPGLEEVREEVLEEERAWAAQEYATDHWDDDRWDDDPWEDDPTGSRLGCVVCGAAAPEVDPVPLSPLPAPQQPVRVTKVGRNEPCPCGSGKKYKKCCLRKGAPAA